MGGKVSSASWCLLLGPILIFLVDGMIDSGGLNDGTVTNGELLMTVDDWVGALPSPSSTIKR